MNLVNEITLYLMFFGHHLSVVIIFLKGQYARILVRTFKKKNIMQGNNSFCFVKDIYAGQLSELTS